MSRSVRLSWGWPTERVDGSPATANDIEKLVIEAKVAAAPESAWTEVAVVPYAQDATERLFPDLPVGTWQFRGTVHGTREGDVSDPLVAEVQVPADDGELARLGPLTQLTAELV